MPWRNYRDPLHNIISLDESLPEDRLIVDLIDSTEFQRLRRIRQLGLAMFTYQGAEQSRFTHSLGVMQVMTRALDLLGAKHTIPEDSRVVGRAGALLHDLGHGPLSHVVEKVFRFHHEDWTRRIILDETTEVNRILRAFDVELPAKLASLYQHRYSPAFVSQLVSSQLDCDRMDYLLRDSLMTGAKYGIYDLEWVLHALRIDESRDRIYVESKGLYAVEEYLQARYYMFRQVYFHRTLRSAEAVLNSALKRARTLMSAGQLRFCAPDQVFEKLLSGEQVSTGEYLQLDDTDVMFRLKTWSGEQDVVLADLARRLLHRRLFKALDVGADVSEEFWVRASEVIRSSGFDPEYYLVTDRAADVPYSDYSPVGADPSGLIYVEASPQSPPREISEISDVVRGMHAYRIDRVCVPSEVADQISALIGEHSAGSAGK